jgi:nitrite reductase/ring-hydroxylating ferredoxin subunit
MSEHEKKLYGFDFAHGVALADIAEGGIILGHVAGDAVLLARRGHELFAIGAECTRYHGPLADGVLVEDTVRCPGHHACFSLSSGKRYAHRR